MKILHRTTDCGIAGTVLGNDALDRVFTYDPLNRLLTASGRESDTNSGNLYIYTESPVAGTPNATNVRAYNRTYSYDKLGNVQQVKQTGTNGFTRDFIYNANVNTLNKIQDALQVNIENYSYDANGNQLTAGSTRKYFWNAGDQIVGFMGSNTLAQYDYSGQNRVSKFVKTGTDYERVIYIDGVFEYHILEKPSVTYKKNYVHVMDDSSRIAEVRIGQSFPNDITNSVVYNLETNIGSSSVRLDNNGTVIDNEEYYPFGDSSLRTFTYKRYRYVGKERDRESGLYYYGARYYAAWTCRFISVDPLADKYVHITPYNYADNNPINDYDIDGQQDNNTKQTGGNVPIAASTGGVTATSSSFSGGCITCSQTVANSNPETTGAAKKTVHSNIKPLTPKDKTAVAKTEINENAIEQIKLSKLPFLKIARDGKIVEDGKSIDSQSAIETVVDVTEGANEKFVESFQFTRTLKVQERSKGMTKVETELSGKGGSGKFLGQLGMALDGLNLFGDAYKIQTAKDSREKDAAIKETKKDIGGIAIETGLSRINPVLTVITFWNDYYSTDKEFIMSMYYNLREKADAIDASQSEKKQFYDWCNKYESVIYGNRRNVTPSFNQGFNKNKN
ncbi:MAG: RHS repeat-associated core domain-containing protein [Sediminibacterium sp.]|nr:RHS repeat-associated core domain-containing protein [Sediminibacterium sp.]